MIADSIKIKKIPEFNDDAVNKAYIGDVKELLNGKSNIVESINDIKKTAEKYVTGDGMTVPITTSINFIKGQTFLNIVDKQTFKLIYPVSDLNYFAQVQVDVFIDDLRVNTIDKWNFDLSTDIEWKKFGDPILFEGGLVRFNTDSVKSPNKWAMLISDKNQIDLSKVKEIKDFLIKLDQPLNSSIKFLFSKNDKGTWMQNDFTEIIKTEPTSTDFAKGFTMEDITSLSKQELSRFVVNGKMLDIAILVKYETSSSKPTIDYINLNLLKNGYWYPSYNLPNGSLSIMKLDTGVEITNKIGTTEDFKVTAILGNTV